MSEYWLEFFTLAGVHLIAVASPGPDFAVVVRHAISHGRKVAIWCSIGIGFGILLHVTYSLLGIGLLIKTTPWLYQGLIFIAAGYFVFIGIGALRASAQVTSGKSKEINKEETKPLHIIQAFRVGFITNGLNPKATLFFLSLFSVVVSFETPLSIKMMYGIYLAIATGLWFIVLSMLLSSAKIDVWLQRYRQQIDRVMGAVLIFMGLSLLYQELVSLF